MKFCTKCGVELQANEVHTCTVHAQPSENFTEEMTPEAAQVETSRGAQVGSSSSAALATAKEQLRKVDKNKIWTLLKNPMASLQLQKEHDLMYGIMGLVASLIGFVLWAWSFKYALVQIVMDQLTGFFGGRRESYSEASQYLSIVGYMLIVGLVSLVVLLSVTYLLGNKLGTQRTDWKNVMVKFGGLQLLSGAAFIVSAILMFISMKLSFGLMLITLLTTLVMTVYAGMEWFRIPRERAVLFIAAVVFIQVIAVSLVFNSFGAELTDGLQDLF